MDAQGRTDADTDRRNHADRQTQSRRRIYRGDCASSGKERGQRLIDHEQVPKFREMILQVVCRRANDDTLMTFTDKPTQNFLESTFAFAFNSKMHYAGLEPSDLGTVRIAYSGKRAVVTAPLASLLGALGHGIVRSEVKEFLMRLTCEDLKKLLDAEDSKWSYTILNMGDIFYTPAGYVILEHTLQTEPVHGVRLTFLHGSPHLSEQLQLACDMDKRENPPKTTDVKEKVIAQMAVG